jgi:hypothetical protein
VRFIEPNQRNLIQAELGKFSRSTIERKQMSTKTTFKRIALVAVAALGLSLVAVTPSNATPQADTLTSSATTATALPGADAKITVTQTYLSTGTSDTVTATAAIVSMPAGNSVLPTWITTLATGVTNAGSPTQSISGLVASSGSVAASTYVKSNFQLVLNTQVAGTYVIKVTPQTGSVATALTLTYTIADTATGPTAKASRVYMQAGAGTSANKANALVDNGGGYAKVANSTVTAAALLTALGAGIATQDADTTNNVTKLSVTGGSTTSGTTVANFGVILGNSETITASTLIGASQCDTVRTGCAAADYTVSSSVYFNAAGFPVTATVTGPGYLKYGSDVKGKTYTELSTDGQVNYLQKSFYLVSDGVAGTSTVTFTAGGVTLGTFTVYFADVLASYTVATGTTFSGSSFPVATNTGAYKVTALDANKNPIAGATVYAYSGTAATGTITTSATTSAAGVATFDFTGLVAGTSVITFGNKSTLATSTITATTTAAVTGSTATTVKLSLDKAEYAPGEKMTITISATDSNGKPVADGSRAVIASPTSNVVVGCTLSATTTLLGGSATQTCYAPATSGEFKISATEGADTASTTKATVSVTATVTNASLDAAQAATDAAAEATDAANAATDAANAAAEAADAATAAAQDAADAVAALSTQVAEMIDALKKQITALTNLVIKIQKKVKA